MTQVDYILTAPKPSESFHQRSDSLSDQAIELPDILLREVNAQSSASDLVQVMIECAEGAQVHPEAIGEPFVLISSLA